MSEIQNLFSYTKQNVTPHISFQRDPFTLQIIVFKIYLYVVFIS